jgi:hypothetical protein
VVVVDEVLGHQRADAPMSWSGRGQRASVVPRHPRRRVFGDALVTALERDEIAEDVDLGELGGVKYPSNESVLPEM